ncbi:hypothetical protein [Streptomyces xylophagus]|uniref:hypothetical protein n=1 Tax=Streptomyces xylophagus TaxID=285514 RepID=UPI00131CD926|nr:hypothetical protein [Streptomyces xylophagus]
MSYDGSIDADHSTYLIDVDAGVLQPPGGERWEFDDGLIAVRPHQMCVTTGIDDGEVKLHIELHDTQPPVTLDNWDEVAEASLTCQASLTLGELFTDPRPGLPQLAAHGPGSYRIRVSARGRDTAHEFPEEHSILCWPTPQAPPMSLKLTDQSGARYRHRLAQRRPSI